MLDGQLVNTEMAKGRLQPMAKTPHARKLNSGKIRHSAALDSALTTSFFGPSKKIDVAMLKVTADKIQVLPLSWKNQLQMKFKVPLCRK